jgi:CheY-like chemotaxis protein
MHTPSETSSLPPLRLPDVLAYHDTHELPELSPLVNEAGDDRANIRPGDRVILIVENDLAFARVLLEAAREKGFKGLVTSLGAAALAMTREHEPDLITLDILLPDIEGWRVMDRLKNDVSTRHIPVCIMSTEESRERALTSGAVGFVAKPLQTRAAVDELIDRLNDYQRLESKHLVVVEPDARQLERIRDLLAVDDVHITAITGTPAELHVLDGTPVDCLVVNSNLPDDVLATLGRQVPRLPGIGRLPVIVFGPGEVTRDDPRWKQCDRLTVRRAVSPERLLDQMSLFLHCKLEDLPDSKRALLEGLHLSDKVLPGKKVLVVDDDMRNIFALTAVLEEQDMRVASADNGRDAIRILQEQEDIDIVLMDIMMPEMDGIDTMCEIRKVPSLKSLPIIAVTAKAMKGDREKCIEAGAWDYLSKPVDAEQLLAVLRAWLHR